MSAAGEAPGGGALDSETREDPYPGGGGRTGLSERISAWVVGVLLAILYAYLVVSAVGNLVGLQQMAGVIGLQLTGVGWFWLLSGIALPVLVLLLALLAGRRRGAGARLLVLAAGLALVAAVQLEVMHLVPQSSFFA